MRGEPLTIEDLGLQNQKRVLRLSGPLTISTLYEFQTLVRTNSSASLVIDFTNVPYIDSAGIGALVAVYVRHQRDANGLSLVGVNDRVRTTLDIARIKQFFRFFDSLEVAQAKHVSP